MSEEKILKWDEGIRDLHSEWLLMSAYMKMKASKTTANLDFKIQQRTSILTVNNSFSTNIDE